MMKEWNEHGCCARAPLVKVLAEPRVASAQISQLVAGCCVDLLEKRDDWYRVRGPDEYEGWVHQGYLSPAPDTGARQSLRLSRMSLGCITTDGSGGRRAMPLGALLAPDERVKTGEVIAVAEQATR